MVMEEQVLCHVAMALWPSAVLSSYSQIVATILLAVCTVCLSCDLPCLSGSSAQLWPLPLWRLKLTPISCLKTCADPF